MILRSPAPGIRRPLTVLGLMVLLPTGLHAAEFRFTGTASAKDGRVLYTETHQVTGRCEGGVFRPSEDVARYRQHSSDGSGDKGNSGEEIASKTADYNGSPLRPAVHFQQPGFDESIRIDYPEAGQVRIRWTRPNGDTKRWQIDQPKRLVVDAGFDNLVRQNWDTLKAGKTVSFRFLAPTRGDYYGFDLVPENVEGINAALEVAIKPTSTVLSFLVDPIHLGYNDRGALTDYRGLTNIRKNADGNYDAHIRYRIDAYPDCSLLPAGE